MATALSNTEKTKFPTKISTNLLPKAITKRGKDQDHMIEKKIVKSIKITKVDTTSKKKGTKMIIRSNPQSPNTKKNPNTNKKSSNLTVILKIIIHQRIIASPINVGQLTKILQFCLSKKNSTNSAKVTTSMTCVTIRTIVLRSMDLCSKLTIASGAEFSRKVKNIKKMSSSVLV